MHLRPKQLTTYLLIFFILKSEIVFGQKNKKKENYLDFTVGPHYGFRLIGDFDLPVPYSGNKKTFKDSLRKADGLGKTIQLGLNYVIRKKGYSQIAFGLNYVQKSFTRIRTNVNVGDVIHPQIGPVAGIIQSGAIEIDYIFKYKYLEAHVMWYSKMNLGRKVKESSLWLYGGLAPSVLLSDKMMIKSIGFTLDGKNKHWVTNDEFRSLPINLDLKGGARLEQFIYKDFYGLVQPNFRIPMFPAFTGAQTTWIPQFGLEVGFSLKI